jgi:hypothetical protein
MIIYLIQNYRILLKPDYELKLKIQLTYGPADDRFAIFKRKQIN